MNDSDPKPDQWCDDCGASGHLRCWDAGLELMVGPLIAIHDAVLAVHGEEAAS